VKKQTTNIQALREVKPDLFKQDSRSHPTGSW